MGVSYYSGHDVMASDGIWIMEHAETLFAVGWCLILVAAIVIAYLWWASKWEPEDGDDAARRAAEREFRDLMERERREHRESDDRYY